MAAYEVASRSVVSNTHRWEGLFNLAYHSPDHRPQILAIPHRRFGMKTIEQDMIFFLWGEDHVKL